MTPDMAEIEIQTGLQENTAGFVELFAEVAATDPVSAAIMAVGAVLVVFSAGVMGVLALGGVLSSVRRLFPTSPAPRPRGR